MKKQAIILLGFASLALASTSAVAQITDTLNEVGPGSSVTASSVTTPFTPWGTLSSMYYYATANEFGPNLPPTLTYFDNSPIPFGVSGSVVIAGSAGAVVTFGSETTAMTGSTGEPYAYWDYAEFFAAGAQNTTGFLSVPLVYTPTSTQPGFVPGYTVTYDFQPVPEPTTIISGALALLPVGASALRILRRRQLA